MIIIKILIIIQIITLHAWVCQEIIIVLGNRKKRLEKTEKLHDKWGRKEGHR